MAVCTSLNFHASLILPSLPVFLCFLFLSARTILSLFFLWPGRVSDGIGRTYPRSNTMKTDAIIMKPIVYLLPRQLCQFDSSRQCCLLFHASAIKERSE
ncbi:uncharacterized protein VTP21DRAFT_5952 [Calcarisporiella thermophila]|uniref:uncharacterized protein n=1 Tax=Calcarisporiella thermophila TaxID=911321 RepID=UPI0037442503